MRVETGECKNIQYFYCQTLLNEHHEQKAKHFAVDLITNHFMRLTATSLFASIFYNNIAIIIAYISKKHLYLVLLPLVFLGELSIHPSQKD